MTRLTTLTIAVTIPSAPEDEVVLAEMLRGVADNLAQSESKAPLWVSAIQRRDGRVVGSAAVTRRAA
jgi:hypothetical protein